MLNRRRFFGLAGATAIGSLLQHKSAAKQIGATGPLVISTWAPNVKANKAAWAVLQKGGRALDAVEQGIWVPEADPDDQSVGYGGLPDRDGRVTLDACIMDEAGNCGAVMALEEILHPISVARLVMEKTPHVQLVGEGALRLALANGFKRQNLLTPKAKRIWQDWLKQSKYDPKQSIDILNKQAKKRKGSIANHDTIGLLAMDAAGNMSGGCSTSGMAFKMQGRVGDSPIIGAGLFVDNEVGAATATGVGEEVVKICGAHTVVEAMRHGLSPEAACKAAVERMLKRPNAKELQVGFIALNKQGEFGGYALQKDFNYAVHTSDGPKVYDAKSIY